MSKKPRREGQHHRGRSDLPPRHLHVHPECSNVIDRLNGREVLNALRGTYEALSGLDHELSECNSFSFLSPDNLQQLAGRELASEALFFWREINQLMIFVIRTASRAVLSLLEGVVTAIQTHNELLLSLVARAFIEHACSLNHLASTVDRARPRLIEEVWPAYTAGPAPERIRPTDDDQKLQEALLRYAVGRRVQLGEADPPAAEDSRSRWEDYLKSLKDVPGHLASEQVLNSIDKTSSKNLRTATNRFG